ncbi:MAG: ABC transporter permease subunit [Gammaproteobacteria bacterium]|nr:ABC transporter permease subunit [Gammaproteobacteria bacterium]
MNKSNYYQKPLRLLPINIWDITALLLILLAVTLLAWGAQQMAHPFQLGQIIPISLDPQYLPGYAWQTVLRMLIAMVFSLLFTFTIGTLAAKSKHAAKIILPMIDILQSVPVLGFLSLTIAGFIALFPHSLLGPECACIFVIFTAQAWNMTLGFYQSLLNVPQDLQEAAAMFHLSAWQRFWRVDVPLAMPSLLWNMMMSMSASWVFLVASEAISVANQNITLPGIGSYIALAIKHADPRAITYAIITTLIVIVLYDQILFRPLMAWSQKFRFEQEATNKIKRSWVTFILQRTKFIHYSGKLFSWLQDVFINNSWFNPRKLSKHQPHRKHAMTKSLVMMWYTLLVCLIMVAFVFLLKFIFLTLSLNDAWQVAKFGGATLLRVMATIFISAIVWVPIGVWIGLRPRVANFIQPIIQFLAAFPANLLFPIMIFFIMRYQLNVQVWVTLLMISGSQWYILFNIIAGTSTLPSDYHYAAANLGVKGWLWWKRLVLPAIFPYFITGAITAAGAAWNLSIIAEVITWGDKTLVAYGLGAYIAKYTMQGDFHRIALGITVMCIFVLVFNYLVWQPLYKMAEKRFAMN